MGKAAAFGGGGKQLSGWPKGSFFAVRVVQLVCAIVPAAIVSFFVAWLKEAKYEIPWQFTIIFIAGVLTIVNAVLTGLLVFWKLSTILVLVVDWVCLVLWIVSWGALAQALKKNVLATCSTTNWGNSDGVRVCNFYKIAFAFSIVSTATMCITILIATSVRQHRGDVQYAPMDSNAQLRQENDYELQPPMQNTQTSYASTAYTDDGLRKPNTGGNDGSYSDEPAVRQPSPPIPYYAAQNTGALPPPPPIGAGQQTQSHYPQAGISINLDDSADTAYDSYRPQTDTGPTLPPTLLTGQTQANKGQMSQSPSSMYSPYPDSARTPQNGSYDNYSDSTAFPAQPGAVAHGDYSPYSSSTQPVVTAYGSYPNPSGDLGVAKADYAAYTSYQRG